MTQITIDCARCVAPAGSCDDCVVRAMLDIDGSPTLNGEQQAALRVLSQSNLVPPLRLLMDGETGASAPKQSVAA